jgi:hypothetical protein
MGRIEFVKRGFSGSDCLRQRLDSSAPRGGIASYLTSCVDALSGHERATESPEVA